MIIPFEEEYRKKFYELENQIFDSNFWSEGKALRTFEDKFGEYVKLGARAVSNGGAGLLAILEYIGVRGKDVLLPSNTFWADARAIRMAGGKPIYVDCNREDLCMSFEDMKLKITSNTKAVIIVHIGGHIAFQIEEIAKYCQEKGVYLVEDCAHVHGDGGMERPVDTMVLLEHIPFMRQKPCQLEMVEWWSARMRAF